MGGALENPKRPFVAVLGGAKVSDKIGVINNLLEKADTIIIGGGMAYTFARAQGGSIGKSLLRGRTKLDYALEMIQKAKDRGRASCCCPPTPWPRRSSPPTPTAWWSPPTPSPTTWRAWTSAPRPSAPSAPPSGAQAPWCGTAPWACSSFEKFAAGTRAMAQALAGSGAITIVGGGDSAAAVEQMGFADKITHISTGGGASLEFLEGIELPGVACLLDK